MVTVGKPLIQGYHVNAPAGEVRLKMPDLDPLIAEAVRGEVKTLSQAGDVSAFTVENEGAGLSITVANKELTRLAADVTKLMTRRVAELGERNTPVYRASYASLSDVSSVLDELKAHAQKKSPHAGIVIDRLKAVAQKVELN